MNKQFKIAEVERFTDIKAHTFRTWEYRFNFFQPRRTKTGIRYYTLEDVAYLLNINLLNKAGYKISYIAQLSDEEKDAIIINIKDDRIKKLKAIQSLVITMYSSDIEKFEFILDNCVSHWQIDSVITDILIPFLERVSLLCYIDTTAETHFVVNAIRKKLIVAIEKQTLFTGSDKTALLFLPKNEHYDLMLLYVNFLLKSFGIRTFYLGTDVAFSDLAPILLAKQPDYIFTYLHPRQRISPSMSKEMLGMEKACNSFYPVVCDQPSTFFTSLPDLKFVHYKKVAELLESFSTIGAVTELAD